MKFFYICFIIASKLNLNSLVRWENESSSNQPRRRTKRPYDVTANKPITEHFARIDTGTNATRLAYWTNHQVHKVLQFSREEQLQGSSEFYPLFDLNKQSLDSVCFASRDLLKQSSMQLRVVGEETFYMQEGVSVYERELPCDL